MVYSIRYIKMRKLKRQKVQEKLGLYMISSFDLLDPLPYNFRFRQWSSDTSRIFSVLAFPLSMRVVFIR